VIDDAPTGNPTIDETIRTYLDAVDAKLPGYVRGLYVIGSFALGDWQPGASDIDTVILTSGPAEEAVLAEIHAGMPAAPSFDGFYAGSVPLPFRSVVPFVVNGEFHGGEPCGEVTPLTWLTLQRYGVRVRGPAVADLGLRVDPDEVRQYNLDNLRDYWLPLVAGIPPLSGPVPADAVVWLVLGPARLHHTLAHGDIISKAAAAEHLAGLFPHHAGLARRAVEHRAGVPHEFTADDLHAAAESVREVVADAVRRG
jgi:hypothetical protein